MASLLCLLPAYQTILLAAQRHRELFTADHQVKISHQTMAQCIQDAQAMVADNEPIQQYGRQIRQAIDSAFEVDSGQHLSLSGLTFYPTHTQYGGK